ncbi:MAG: cyclic nucleotide-binding domain-containing protein [Bacteroidota bacterium]
MEPILNLEYLQATFPEGSHVTLDRNTIIARPHQKVTKFSWLLKGTVKYYMPLERSTKEVLVSKISAPFMPVGWGGLNAPYRFGMKIKVASKTATFFNIELTDSLIRILSKKNPFLLKNICVHLYHQLGLNLVMQGEKLSPRIIKDETAYENYFISPESSIDEVTHLFFRSPFLSEFSEAQVQSMAVLAERRDYERGEVIIGQDTYSDGLFVVIQGEVAIRRIEQENQINMRSISSPGFLFGWSSLIDRIAICETITTTKTSAYFIPTTKLINLLKADQKFSALFYLRLIWLIGNQLNISFTRYLNLKLNHDVLATQNLLYNAKSRLKLSSSLHQIPHLLENNATKPMAFSILHELNKSGISLEKHIASICLDLLKREEEETKFIRRLQNIYEVVAEKNQGKEPAIVRKECAKATKEVFEHLHYVIEGQENLPAKAGHIFIYNHLVNSQYYTLGNNFQITLDSHFISSLLLNEAYGDPGIRTVRIGKGHEYGHQDYYERLGYINVYTKESDTIDPNLKSTTRSVFYTQANQFLDEGYNLIISPEGTSYRTEESPGPFKTGAFRLAAGRDPMPLIVPIVLCNFDRRIQNNTFYCKILTPINLNQHPQPIDEDALKKLIADTEIRYIDEVKQARKKFDFNSSKEAIYE